MADLNLDRVKTAVLSMDIQKATVRRSSMFRERNVGQAAKSVLEAARKAGILVVHVATAELESFRLKRLPPLGAINRQLQPQTLFLRQLIKAAAYRHIRYPHTTGIFKQCDLFGPRSPRLEAV